MRQYKAIEIETIEPVKIGAGGSKTNQTEPSKDYIPGSTIRGAIIGVLIREGFFRADNARFVLLQMECYNAYPFVRDKLYIPTPAHLRMDKHKWREYQARRGREEHSEPIVLVNLLEKDAAQQAKNELEYSFVTVHERQLIGMRVDREYRLHHSTSKKPDEKERENLFRYQAIAAGQTFRAIVSMGKEVAPMLDTVLEKPLSVYLGGSKGSGYGRCVLRAVSDSLSEYRDAKRETGLGLESEFRPGGGLTITCLSDCIFRDDHGRPVNRIPERTIEAITGHTVRTATNLVIRTGLTEGYNVTWRARYPKETTVKAGSVMHYSFYQEPDPEQWKAIAYHLEKQLIGQRTQDGYGWVGVNLSYPLRLKREESLRASADGPEKADLASVLDRLQMLLQTPAVRQTMSVIVSGFGDARQRWLDMIALRSRSERHVVVSDQLNRHQLHRMMSMASRYLERKPGGPPAAAADSVSRGYETDREWCSIAGHNISEIMTYLGSVGHAGDHRLRQFAQMMLRGRGGALFYAGEPLPEQRFIAELLHTALWINFRRRESHESDDTARVSD